MKTNREMDVLWDEILEEHLDNPEVLPQKLLTLLNAGFLEQDQCVFLSALRKEAPVERLDFPDCTGYECFVNHIHVEDYLENGGLPPLELLGCGIALARELKARLSGFQGMRHFRIIVIVQGATCSVRFHTIRPDEEWMDKDLHGYREEAIAILETHESEP